MNASQILWTEKYRPKSLDEMILPNRILTKFQNGAYQNLLLTGSSGRGKTSLAKILASDHTSIYINCSLDTGIDNVRTKIVDFCSTISVFDDEVKMKIVILDEFDGVSDAYMKALRGTIEQFHKTTRFIATCNYINKIPDNIQSRFEVINFDFSKDEEAELIASYYKRIYTILKAEGIEIEKSALIELVDRQFPDLRSTISTLQGFHAEGIKKITLSDVKRFHGAYKELYEYIFDSSKNEISNYEFLVSNYSNNVDEVIGALGVDFIEYIKLEKPYAITKIGEIAYEVNNHSYQLRFVIDPVVCMLSLVFKIQLILRVK